MDVVNENDPPVNPVSLETRPACIQRYIQQLSLETRQPGIQRYLQRFVVHACQCRDTDCSLPPCRKLKSVLDHTKVCERRITADCVTCTRLVALFCYHGKLCTMRICPVPYCLLIQKRRREKKRWQLEQYMTAERRKDVTDLLLEAISSSTDPVIFRMSTCDKESYAKRLERKIFELADTVDEYNRILAGQKWEIEMNTEAGQRWQSNQGRQLQ